MNWEAVGAIGEVVGAVGVILTLVYLAVQIRQNSAVVRSATRQAISTTQSEIGFRLAESPQLLAVAKDFSDVTHSLPEDELRAHYFLRAVFRTFENQYHQYRDATFDASLWTGYRHNIALTFRSPATRAFWAASRSLYSAEFVAFVDSELLGDGDARTA